MGGEVDFAVLGAAGQLGRELLKRLPTGTAALTRADADLSQPGSVGNLLRKLRPRILFNCAAYNLVDLAEDQAEQAMRVNALGVRELALACREVNATLVHFSTDYVFGAQADRKTPYLESDSPGPLSTYGASKLTGEYFVRAYCPRHLVIRTCGLYGRHGAGGKGGNFVETMLRLAGSGRPIRVVSDQVLTPSSAVDVAGGTMDLIRSGANGLFHLSNAGECSWHEFAKAIFQFSGLSVDLQPISTAEFGSKAARPAYSVLNSCQQESPRLRPWLDALREYLSQRSEVINNP